ncbi:hypothetical protein [Nocardia arizonensis]|uniref:hypothetical protein n=1 Tax=Nocardia arizonensis TaxID=1141647 RepID=UPI0006D1F211|nr:hypothetical protein [Nocardia arizonensis]
MKVLRWFSGVAAAGIVVLTLVVIGAAVVAGRRGFPGPGGEAIAWHLAASVAAVAAQAYSDRRRGFAAFFGSAVVFLSAGILLWTQWWG